MIIEYLGHSCFLISSGDVRLLFDPFLTGNPKATKKPEDVNPTHILVSHAHNDHLGDTIEIAKKSGAKVYSTFEIAENLANKQIDSIAGNIGGRICTEFGSVKFFEAIHTSGICKGSACSFIVTIENKNIYFAGDTALFLDMKLLSDEDIDIAFLPIGDVFTMGIEDAVKAVSFIQPKIVIPMHYNTFPAIEKDPKKFKKQVEAKTKTDVVILSPGKSLEI